jgi:hypothetical protein
LFHLMFEVREVCLQPVKASGIFICHIGILPACPREVETVNDF